MILKRVRLVFLLTITLLKIGLVSTALVAKPSCVALLDQGRVRQQDYEQQVQQWSKDQMGSGGTGGDYYRTKGAYLGERYIELVFSHYHQGHISVEQAADYLGARAKNVHRIEEWLFNQGTRT